MGARNRDDWLKFEDAIAGPSAFKPAAVVAVIAMAALLVSLALTSGSPLSLLAFVAVFGGGTLFVIGRMKRLDAVARPIFEQNPGMNAKDAVVEARRRLRQGRERQGRPPSRRF